MTTNELTRFAIERLQAQGFVVWRTNAGYVRTNVRLAPKGTPDIIGYGPRGRFVGIEIKTGRDKVSETQMKWIARARAHNAFVRIVKTTEELDQAIIEYDDETRNVW